MPLIDTTKTPPKGFFYREVAINWKTPDSMLPFGMVVRQLQTVRAQNPHAGLDPSYGACAKAIDDACCLRLHNDPAWCVTEQDPVAVAKQQEAIKRKSNSGCCGSRKRK
jgi:hypothetical protein